MIIGYSKIGRSMTVDPGKYGFQGDAEAPQLLIRLARRNPDHIFAVVGKHTKNPDTSLFPNNVIWPWVDGMNEDQLVDWAVKTLDANIVHLGQHGTSHQRIPMVGDTWADVVSGEKQPTTPLSSLQTYGNYLTKILNGVGDKTHGAAPVSYICTDPRNYLKARDIKWPTGMNRILSQGLLSRTQNHDRFQDPNPPAMYNMSDIVESVERGRELWIARHTYRHAGLELMILPDDWETWGTNTWENRSAAGVATTAAWDIKPEWRRSHVLNQYLMAAWPEAEVFGKWDERCLADMPEGFELQTNKVADFSKVMERWHVTMALPAITRSLGGAGWTTAKPYQAFAANTICLMPPNLDQSGWIIPSRVHGPGATEISDGLFSVRSDWTEDELTLAKWLRVTTSENAQYVIGRATNDRAVWEWLTGVQRSLLARRWNEHYTERIIEHQLGIDAKTEETV